VVGQLRFERAVEVKPSYEHDTRQDINHGYPLNTVKENAASSPNDRTGSYPTAPFSMASLRSSMRRNQLYLRIRISRV
jgi:hypothetical protein